MPNKFIVIGLWGCIWTASAATELAPPTFARDVKLDKFSCWNGPYKPKVPASRKKLSALPMLISQEFGDDSLSPTTHAWRNFTYDGMKIYASYSKHKPYKGIVVGATFSHRRWNALTPIKIGSPISALLKKADLRDFAHASPISFCSSISDGDAPDCAVVSFENKYITRVEYQCYTG
jgi:hypothetical protein